MTELLVVEMVDGGRPVVFENPSAESRLLAQEHALRQAGEQLADAERRLARLSDDDTTRGVAKRVTDLYDDSPELRELCLGEEPGGRIMEPTHGEIAAEF